MKKKHLFSFNLVEIILAMGVVALGMTAVMALLPPALNANRDAAGDAMAAEAASKMMTWIDLQTQTVNQTSDDTWSDGLKDRFEHVSSSSKPKLSDVSDNDLGKTGSALAAPFDCFHAISGNIHYTYLQTDAGVDNVPMANVIVWMEDLPEPHNYGTGGTVRPGFRFYIKVCWPAEAPAAFDSRQERTFVYEVLRPIVH